MACLTPGMYDDAPEVREGFSETGMLSAYARFWKGCDWEVFLVPEKHQGGNVGQNGATWKVVGSPLQSGAAVYEFALTTRECPHAMVPVYVGESTNVQNRHRDYGRDGSSLVQYFTEFVGRRQLLLWRRIRYVRDKGQAERWEARFLIYYDYAWNAKLNMAKRDIDVSVLSCMWCCALGVLVHNSRNAAVRRTKHAVILTKSFRATMWYGHLLCCVVQNIVGVSIVLIVAIHLEGSGCLLSNAYACPYSYAVGSLNIAASIFIVALMILHYSPEGSCARGLVFLSCFSMCIWMLVYATLFRTQATVEGIEGWKTTVEVMGWVSLGTWVFQSCAWLVNDMLSWPRNPCTCASPV